jgi:2-polyprenyl-6-methoxyphenol hydroxylase-like FAD-dependent oxidoreductase
MNDLRQHAIVIGGSMAGLLAARVLADHFSRVTIIERDSLPTTAEVRNGVPQARHLHILLARGLEIIEELFPGIGGELEAGGSPELHWGKDSIARFVTGWTPIFESHVRTRATSRALLEWTVRRRLTALPHISILEQTVVDKLVTTIDQERVTGVMVARRGVNEEPHMLEADLVVDASGRGSQSAEWLSALGYGQVEETEINSFLGYATRWYNRPSNFPERLKSITIGAQPPDNLRGGIIMELENGQWIVTMAGSNKDYPPTDEEGFLEFARSLMTCEIYDAIRSAEPISGIYGYRRTENRLKHFERLARWPEQFVVMGDAACAFNPVYGQGMTTGALEAIELGKMLNDYAGRGMDGLGLLFQRRLAKVIAIPWLMATGEDLRYPGTVGGNVNWRDRLVQKYIEQVIKVMPGNPDIADVFFQVMNLLRSPAALFQPQIMLAVLKKLIFKQPATSIETFPIPKPLGQTVSP